MELIRTLAQNRAYLAFLSLYGKVVLVYNRVL